MAIPAHLAHEALGKVRISVKRRYCKKHASSFCPCVAAWRYKKNDPRGDPKVWDKAWAEMQAKRKAKS
jgi:hypothetical protein